MLIRGRLWWKFLTSIVVVIFISNLQDSGFSASTIKDVVRKFTVRIVSQSNVGTGVIVERKDNTYALLTNCHVVGEVDSGNGGCIIDKSRFYTVQTFDAKEYRVKEIKTTKGADVAIVYFESDNNYAIAKLSTIKPTEGSTKIYIFGYPGSQDINNPWFRADQVIHFRSQPNTSQDKCIGYQITVGISAPRGMSGSPLLDSSGDLLGIFCGAQLGFSTTYIIWGQYIKKLFEEPKINIQWTIATSSDNIPEQQSLIPANVNPAHPFAFYIAEPTKKISDTGIFRILALLSAQNLKPGSCTIDPGVVVIINDTYGVCAYPNQKYASGRYSFPRSIPIEE